MVSGINGTNYNPYELYSTPDKTNFAPFQYQPILTGGVSTIGDEYAAKKDNTADGKDDGSIGFWGATKNMAKGVWNFLTSPFKNDKGEWSLGSTLKSAAIAGLFIAGNALTGGALTPILLAGGAIAGGIGAVKAGYNIATAETDAQAEAAWQSMGSSAATIAATAVGAKSYAKASAAKAGMSEAEISARYDGVKGIKNAVGKTFVDSKENIVAGAKTGWNYGTTKFGQVTQAYKDGTLKTKVADKYNSLKETATQTYNDAKTRYNKVRTDWKAMTTDERKAALANLKQTVIDTAKNKVATKLGYQEGQGYLANAKNIAGNPQNIGIHTYLTKQSFAPDFYDSLSKEEQAYFDSLPKEQREEIEDMYYSMV